jgi:hypothetical protein
VRFNWKVGLRLLSKNHAIAPLGRSGKLNVEVAHPSVRLEGRRRLHPTERLCACSISAEVDLRLTQSYGPTGPRRGGSYPSIVQLLGHSTALVQRCRGWNNPLAESAPIPQTHGCEGLYSASEHLRLRKPPADMLVTWGKAVEQSGLLGTPH